MQRFHSAREHALMFRRWKQEMESHGYDWRCPPTEEGACHCARGIGSMRRHRVYGCGKPRCLVCHWPKLLAPKARATRRREAVGFELMAVDEGFEEMHVRVTAPSRIYDHRKTY